MGECRASANRERRSTVSAPSRVMVNWLAERKFEAGREGRPSIVLDGDGNEALASLASCISVDVVDILAKRRTPVEKYAVEVLGERVDTIPRHFKHITLNISIIGAGIERAPAEHAIDLAVNKYCSVKDSLRPDVPVVWNLVLNDHPAA